MLSDRERRDYKGLAGKVEDRADGAAGKRIVGHAAVFNSLSEDLGGFREKILPGCFAASIGADNIRALIEHDAARIIGRNVAGTLRLAEDDVGLAVGIDLVDTARARDLIVDMECGNLTQMSFAFRTISDEWSMENGETVRTLKAVQLFDVSVVSFPAYPQTDAAVRSRDAWAATRSVGVVPINLMKARELIAAVI
jgi:HK97 family phage prohead protease